jgi:carboxylesterase
MKNSILIGLVLVLFSCSKPDKLPPIDNTIDLDGTTINDSSLLYPERYLLSAKIPTPNIQEKNTPIYICVHGFSATTFEWLEFRDFVNQKGNAFTSLILLGGHGRDYIDFKNASWTDWQQPILTEYNKLLNLGYTKIYLIGSSTACPLILDLLNKKAFSSAFLKKIIFIDPIIVPSNKTLSLINAVGPSLSYTTTEMEVGENGFWYKYRPYQALEELNTITIRVRKSLEKGIETTIPIETYKSEKDGSADPISSVLIEKGIKPLASGSISTTIVPSDLHVFTRLKGRNSYSSADLERQLNLFNKITNN